MTFEELNNSTQAAITVADGASILGLDARTVSRGIEEGTIPGIRIGRRVLIPRLPFLRMLTGDSLEAAA